MNTHPFSCEETIISSSYFPYLIPLTDRARKQRKHPTPAERLFWEAVRNKRFMKLKFIRQKPLLSFIADFYCAKLKLAVEIDGDVHEAQEEYDQFRTSELEKRGIRVIRYTNIEVIHDLNTVMLDLKEKITTP
jgi:very-short-patch-repair endonuclease